MHIESSATWSACRPGHCYALFAAGSISNTPYVGSRHHCTLHHVKNLCYGHSSTCLQRAKGQRQRWCPMGRKPVEFGKGKVLAERRLAAHRGGARGSHGPKTWKFYLFIMARAPPSSQLSQLKRVPRQSTVTGIQAGRHHNILKVIRATCLTVTAYSCISVTKV